MIKNGTRLQSQVCDTQVIVVRTADSLDDLRAGGVPLVPIDSRNPAKATEFSWIRVLRRRRDGQALRRRDRRRSARHQGRSGDAQHRLNRTESEGSQAAAGQRLTRWPHEATQPASSIRGRPRVRLSPLGRRGRCDRHIGERRDRHRGAIRLERQEPDRDGGDRHRGNRDRMGGRRRTSQIAIAEDAEYHQAPVRDLADAMGHRSCCDNSVEHRRGWPSRDTARFRRFCSAQPRPCVQVFCSRNAPFAN